MKKIEFNVLVDISALGSPKLKTVFLTNNCCSAEEKSTGSIHPNLVKTFCKNCTCIDAQEGLLKNQLERTYAREMDFFQTLKINLLFGQILDRENLELSNKKIYFEIFSRNYV